MRSRRLAAQARRQRRARCAVLPEYLPGATEFSRDLELQSPLYILDRLRRLGVHQSIWDDLVAKTTIEFDDGRKRMSGSWIALYIAYVMSGEPAVLRFYALHLFTNPGIARLCGFDPNNLPSYKTVHLRFAELEQDEFVAAVDEATRRLIRHAISCEPRIGRDVDYDATAYSSPSRFHHDCPDPRACRKAGGRPRGTLEREDLDSVIATRHAEVRDEPPEDHSTMRTTRKAREVKNGVLYVWIGKHRYRCLDVDAGARTYTRPNGGAPRSWIGGLDMLIVDSFTGGTLSELSIRADDREHRGYPALLRKLEQATGSWPDSVAADAGISTKQVFRMNTRRGIASVIDWRKPNGSISRREQMRTDRYDEHGIPRCAYCGGPGTLSAARCGLVMNHGNPVLRFRCRTAATPECITKLQQIRCDEEWRLLVPLSRLNPRYHGLKSQQKNKEQHFQWRRNRYGAAGKDITGRLKRRGKGVHTLRGSVSRFVEWIQISLRHGYIAGHKTLNTRDVLVRSGEKTLQATLRARIRHELELPYGPPAVRLGFIAAPSP